MTVLVSGLLERHRPVLAATGMLDRLESQGQLFASTPEAISRARALSTRPSRHLEPPLAPAATGTTDG